MTHWAGYVLRQAAAWLFRALRQKAPVPGEAEQELVRLRRPLQQCSLDTCKGVLLRRKKGAVEVAQKAFDFEQGLGEGRCSASNERTGRAAR